MDVATISAGLPALPNQILPQACRRVTIKGCIATDNGTRDVEITSNAPLIVHADAAAEVTLEVQEVLVNGRVSEPCRITFCPTDRVQAKAADPSGWTVEVLQIEPGPSATGVVPGEGTPTPPTSEAQGSASEAPVAARYHPTNL